MSGFVKVVLDISNTDPPKQPDIIKCKGVDYIRVVQCKDCKFFTKDDEKWYCKAQLRYTKGNAYCSEGVRKDESDTADND